MWSHLKHLQRSSLKKYLGFRNLIKLSESSFSTENFEAEVQVYQKDGVVLLKNVFEKKWIETITIGIRKNMEEPSKYSDYLVGENGEGLFFNDYFNYMDFSEYHDYIVNSPAAEIAGRLMQSTNSVFFHEHVFFKQQGTKKETPWHHDFSYYPLNGYQNCSIWMPVTPIYKSTGVKFIRKSHLWKESFIPKKFETKKDYATEKENYSIEEFGYCDNIQDYLSNLKEEDILHCELEVGDCVAFHMKCVHGNVEFENPIDRMVIVTRWVGDDVTYAQRPWVTPPPAELFPKDLHFGDRLVENKNFLIPWKKL